MVQRNCFLFALELASEDDSRQIQFRLASLCFDLAHYREAADLLGELIGGAATHPAATFTSCAWLGPSNSAKRWTGHDQFAP